MIESNENIETVAYLRFYSPTQIHGLISAFNPHECARIGQERPGHRGKSTSYRRMSTKVGEVHGPHQPSAERSTWSP